MAQEQRDQRLTFCAPIIPVEVYESWGQKGVNESQEWKGAHFLVYVWQQQIYVVIRSTINERFGPDAKTKLEATETRKGSPVTR